MFKPLNNRVLLKPVTKTSKSGIILPTENESDLGIVVVGNEMVSENQKVYFAKYGYDEIEMNGEKYFVVSVNSLLGVFDE